MRNSKGRLFGFRSNTPWKKGVSIIYYIACCTFFIIAMVTPPLVPASVVDTILTKFSSLLLVLTTVSPAIFLSDTPIRDNLPFFKVKNLLSSMTGLLIVWTLLMYFFFCIESLHSPDYKMEFGAYIFAAFNNFLEAGTK